MKQKSLLKVFFLLCALIVGSTSAWADPTYEWVLVEDYSKLSTSDVYVIACNYSNGTTWYSLKNNQVSTAANLAYNSTLTISNKKITSTVSADETWVIETTTTTGEYYIKSTKGTYYLQNRGDTKSLITSKSSTDNQNIWKIHYQDSYTDKSSNTYTVTGLYNKGASRMLAIYDSNPKTWRAYGNTNYKNIDGDEVVFYKRVELPSYTITAQSNNNSYGTVELSGSTITASPKTGYRVVAGDGGYDVTEGTAAVVNNGDNSFTVTPTTDCTVRINFEEIPSHNVTWNVNGATTVDTYKEGEDIDFPDDPASIGGKVFMGWSTGSIIDPTDVAPSFVTEATMSTSNITYYAVFAKATVIGGEVEKSYGFETTSDDDWTITGPVRSNENPNTGSYSGRINTNNSYVTFKNKVNVKSFSFEFARESGNNNYNVYVETSTDGSSWTAAATYTMSSFPSDKSFEKREKTFDGNTALYVRFHCSNTTAVRYVDDVKIVYDNTEINYSAYCTTIPGTISGTITASGWNTFSSNSALDLSNISNGTAYVATSTSGSDVTLTKTTAIVAAGTGLMINGTAGKIFTINTTSAEATFEGNNLLVGLPNSATVAVAGEGYNYVFGWTDPAEPGFYLISKDEPTLGDNKAYLHTTTALSGKLNIIIDDSTSQEEETDGIKAVSTKVENGVRYNLAGQKVGADYKGIVIVNGKKVIRK